MISPTDAYAIRRRLAGMDVSEALDLTPMTRALLGAANGSTALIESFLAQSSDISKAVLAVDPQADPPVLPTDDEMGYKPDDDQLASAFVQFMSGRYAYFYQAWQEYAGGTWHQTSTETISQQVREFLRRYRSVGIAVSANRVQSVTRLAGYDCHLPDDVINRQAAERARYINMRNGLFNLDNQKLEPHRADLYFINQLPFAYDPRPPKPKWFIHFLQTSIVDETGCHDRDMAALLIEALAYSMTARTDLQASFWMIGKPASGKSTLIALIRALLGGLHATIDLNQMGSNRFLLSGIVGKRAVTFTESSGGMLPDALFKTVVGGTDEVYADVKNRNPIAFRPEAKIWWAMNDAPRTADRSGALLRRLYPILFPRTIPTGERVPDLDQRLAGEMPGIFNILMAGYKRLLERGRLEMPARARQWLDDFERRNDTERTFLEETAIRDLHGELQSSEFYGRYHNWCIDNGFKPKNVNQVSEDWRRLGLVHVHHNDANYWRGIKWRT